MAVAGLQSVSAINSPSFHREPMSPLSRRRQGDNYHDRPRTRASSILQIWRQIESEQFLNRPPSRVVDKLQQQLHEIDEDVAVVRQESGCGESSDENGSSSEQSSDIGEFERVRVRQVFREWNQNGVVDHPLDVSNVNSSSGAQCPGGERERVTREVVAQLSSTGGGGGDQGAQAEEVRQGVQTNIHCGIGARRRIRKLCGRQALLDLLSRAQKDRQKELEDLSQHRPVSNFAYRNRIQSLLRGRFLRTERLIVEERSSARAAGVLRTKHTVSGLREGFRFRSDNVDRGSINSCTPTDTSSNNDVHEYRIEQTHTSQDVLVIEGNSDLGNNVRDSDLPWTILSDAGSNQSDTSSNTDINDYRTEQTQTHILEDLPAVQEYYEPCNDESDSQPNQPVGHENLAPSFEYGASTQPSSSSDFSGMRENAVGNLVKNWEEQECEQISNEVSAEVNEAQESISNEVSNEQNLENMEFTWRENSPEGADGNWRDNTVDELHQEPSGSEGDEHHYLQELHEGWIANERQETLNDSSEETSQRVAPLDDSSEETSQRVAPVRSFGNTFYFPDDENVYSTEIEELLSRRNVTNVLQSDFRESLDLLIQSYAERQPPASFDDEADIDIQSPAIVEQGGQHGGSDHHDSREDERDPFVLSSPTVAFSQTFWEREFQNVRWPQSSLHHQDFGVEWETINDLRIDMAMLQQRMNSMQRMIEACMDMQIELQRSIRQEVSAALNRDAVSTGNKKIRPNHEPNWNNLRKGICCICSDQSINSLLYRCGHLCTCSGCAERLVKEKGRCPMCRAPVVEAVRAYSIQE